MEDTVSLEPDAAPKNSKLARWENVTSIPMLALSVLWVVLITWYVLLGPEALERPHLMLALLGIWLIFIVDYVVRISLAVHKKLFFKESLLDLCSVVIPVLRPFHLLTYLRSLPYFRKPTPSAFRARLAVWGISFAVLFLYTISLFVLEAERTDPNANIVNLGDALWWACVTVTTVGYGDFYPVTIPGRMAAVVLMFGGIVIVGATSAIAVSMLNERLRTLAQKNHGHLTAADAPEPDER